MSDSQQPLGLQPTRLLRPWDFPGKSTGVGYHCLLQGVAIYFSRGSSQPRSPVLQEDSLLTEPPGKPSCNVRILKCGIKRGVRAEGRDGRISPADAGFENGRKGP